MSLVRVLIVDSDTSFATAVSEGLASLGDFDVKTARDFDAALASFSDNWEPDVLLLDVGIPDSGGLVGLVREKHPGLPVIAVAPGDASPDETLPVDVQGVLSKPFFLPDLPELLFRVINREAEAGDEAVDRHVSDVPGLTPSHPTHDDDVLPYVELPPELSKAVGERLDSLSRQMNSCVLLLSQGGHPLVGVGAESDEEMRAVARWVARGWHTAEGGKPHSREIVRFESFENGAGAISLTLYSTQVAGDLYLSAAWGGDLPLVTVRRLVRRAAFELLDVLGSVIDAPQHPS